MAATQKNVEDLKNLLQANNNLKDAVETSLQNANLQGLETIDQFYIYLDKILTHIPSEKDLMPSVREFYFALSKSPDDILRKDEAFNKWINEFVVSRGNFLDTTASTETLESFFNCPDYKIDDYIKGPSGWLTYNQFLARQIKPGLRPVAHRCDNSIVVSPADSTFMGHWQIEDDSTITVKGTTYSIADLFKDSKYKHKFKGGIFTHSFLMITDYHRYHMPVGGIIKEVKKIPANTWVNAEKKSDGSVESIDDVGFQFEHTRGFIIVESEVGLVAVMPVGMGHISSVVLNVEEGIELVKGEEFGYFGFGGSDMIMLFEKDKVEFTAEKEKQYKQGEMIAKAVK